MSLLLTENDEVLRLIINTILQDIDANRKDNDNAKCLALAAIANVGGVEFADALSTAVQKLLCAKGVAPIVRKKAALCLLRLFRRQPEIIVPEEHAEKLVALLDEGNTAVVMAVLSLLRAVVMSGVYCLLVLCAWRAKSITHSGSLGETTDSASRSLSAHRSSSSSAVSPQTCSADHREEG